MEGIINSLNTLFGAPFWSGITAVAEAFVAIATFIMVILTLCSLSKMKKEREAQIKREIVQKVYNVLYQNLENILNTRRIENLESIYPENWKWEEIKTKESFIAYHYLIPQNLFEGFNELSRKLEEYEKIRRLIKKEFENLLTEFIKEKILTQENIERVKNILYFEENTSRANIFELFFWDKDLKEFLNQKNLTGKFVIHLSTPQTDKYERITEEDFNKIFKVIKNREYIFQKLPRNEFQKVVDIYNKAKSLKEEIGRTIQQIAKEKI
jgi:hypothetical protein